MKLKMLVGVCMTAVLASACAQLKPMTSSKEATVQVCPAVVVAPPSAWKKGKDKDWIVARKFEQKIKDQNVPVHTETATAHHMDSLGNAEVAEAWKGTNIGLPQSMLVKRFPNLKRAVELSGEFAATRTEPARIFVEVSDADKKAMKTWLSRGILRADSKSAHPQIVFLPMRKGDVPFVRVEPVDQTQFVAVAK